jgi:hypothetical protein
MYYLHFITILYFIYLRAGLLDLEQNQEHQAWQQRFIRFKKPDEEINNMKDKKQKKFYVVC